MVESQFIQIHAPAKINLWLNVMDKRLDNYHEVSMIMQSLALGDRITIRAAFQEGIYLQSNIQGVAPEDNIAYKAARLVEETYLLPRGQKLAVEINIDKYIPMAAGLAGGSTDAAAVLKGLNQLYNLALTDEQLEMLASQLGSDVPFCLHGGTQIATGRGEILHRAPELDTIAVVLAKPVESLSTAKVYDDYKSAYQLVASDLDRVVEAIAQHDYATLCNLMRNSLEKVSISHLPIIQDLKEAMLDYGADFSMMSGSGPTVFGLTKTREEARHLAQSLRADRRFQDCSIIETTTVARYE